MKRIVQCILIISLICFPQAIAFAQGAQPEVREELADDPGEVQDFADQISDPYEGVNRAIFTFNDTLDVYFLEPVARGYEFVLPGFAERGIRSFFDNLEYPTRLVASLIQGKFGESLNHTGRFLINSTIGLAGFIDVASDIGLEKHYDDIGLALAYHDVGPGSYLMIPFWGPSNVRDFAGDLVEIGLDPVNWLFWTDSSGLTDSETNVVGIGLTAVEIISTRASLIEAIEAAKEASTDYYLFTQGAYYQLREGQLNDKSADGDTDEEWWDDDPDFMSDESYEADQAEDGLQGIAN